ncbi:hypothetical protein E2320_016290, partial [Naja naja]
ELVVQKGWRLPEYTGVALPKN